MKITPEIIKFFAKRRLKKNARLGFQALADVFDLMLELRQPTSVRFVVLRHRSLATGEWIVMPTPLLSDVISNIPIEFDNAAGEAVDAPAGDTVTASISNPALGSVAPGADNASVDFTPTSPPDETQTGTITFTATMADGSSVTTTLDVTLTKDPAVSRAHFVDSSITTRPLVAPAPGP